MIKFSETFPQYINFGNGFRTGLSSRTVLWWAYFDAFTTSVIHGVAWVATPPTDEQFYSFTSSGAPVGNLSVVAKFSGSTATWRTNSAYSTTGQWYQFGITYNNTSTANDPIIYVNGAAVAITETTAPSGTYNTGSTSQTFITGASGGNTINGKTAGLCVYNRILTATEIADAYASRKAIPTYQGLVFAPNLLGAAGLQTFDGTTLAAGNTIADSISGALGTPTGSPVGRGDIYLNY